jgi:SAM-dependent methyltransferase
MGMHTQPRSARPGGMTLSYHSVGNVPNVWRIKETSIAGWYTFDRLGFSGWSSLAQEPDLHAPRIDAVDPTIARQVTSKVHEMLRRSNTSKYTQSKEDFSVGRPYVFFPLQRLNDIVAGFYRLNPLQVLERAAAAAKASGVALVIKRHPLCDMPEVQDVLNDIQKRYPDDVIVSSASVHQLLDGCRCVLVANSGVGLEALLYNKPVITFGGSEYELGSIPIGELADVDLAFAPEMPDMSSITSKFMYYFLVECCFSISDAKSIKRFLDMAISQIDTDVQVVANESTELQAVTVELEQVRKLLAKTQTECGQLRAVASQALDVARRASSGTGGSDVTLFSSDIVQKAEDIQSVTSASTIQKLQQQNNVLKERLSLLDGVFPSDTLPEVLPQDFQGFFANRALHKLLKDFDFQTVLDIGSGEGKQAAVMLKYGKSVTALDYGKSPYYQWRDPSIKTLIGNFNELEFEDKFDCVWASHVLEHQPNVNKFLRKINDVTREGGVVAITVPPLKHQIVGGHLALWNGGMLLYHMVLAGFDCSQASILQYGYNISIIVKKREISFPNIVFDMGDIRAIRQYLPNDLGFVSNQHDDPFNGDIRRLNW